MKTQRIVCFLLAVLLCTALFAGCGKGADDSGSSNTTLIASSGDAAVTDTTPHEPTKEELMGFEPGNYNGQTFRILIPTGKSFEHYAQEQNGELVNDAIYMRNSSVEEYFNIHLDMTQKDGAWANRKDFNNEFVQQVLAGGENYDMVVGLIGVVCQTFSNQNCLNLLDMDYLDLSQNWFVQNQTEKLQINNKLYGMFGDMNLTLYGEVHGMMFNQQLIDELHMDDPYALVNSGEWTLDKMISMTMDAGADLDGQAGCKVKTDRMGMISLLNPMRALLTGFGCEIIVRGDDDVPMVPQAASEKHISAYGKISDLFTSGNYNLKEKTETNAFNAMASDRLLFLPAYIRWISEEIIRNMEGDYGIVPFPKYDTDQDQYISQIATAATSTLFPLNVKDPELSAKVVTYMAYLGNTSVVSTYYETYLQDRLSRTPQMQDMLKLIRDTATINLTTVYSSDFNPVLLTFFEVSYNVDYKHNIASTYKSYCKILSTTLTQNVFPLYE